MNRRRFLSALAVAPVAVKAASAVPTAATPTLVGGDLAKYHDFGVIVTQQRTWDADLKVTRVSLLHARERFDEPYIPSTFAGKAKLE